MRYPLRPFLTAAFAFIASVSLIVPAASGQTLAVPDLSAAPAAAQGGATQTPPQNPDEGFLSFFRGTELGGLFDGYYAWYSTKSGDSSTSGRFHAFDVTHNSFKVSMAEIWLAKAPSKDTPAGFKVRLNFGEAPRLMNFNEPNTDVLNVEEAFASYLAPVGKGLQIDFGKFSTTAGAEVIEAKDDWNYSRSLLFQNAIPLYHAGLRATYPVNDMVGLTFGLTNGWNDVSDNNTGKTVLASVSVKPNSALTVIENYIGGPEKPGTNEGWRHLSDTVVTYTVNPMVSVMGNLDYAQEAPIGGGDAGKWWGVAGYLKYQATPVVAVIPRVEYFDDKAGFSGLAQKISEVTLTLELKPVANFMWRLEYRGDFSDQSGAFVNNEGESSKHQQEIVFGVLYNFSTKP